MRPLRPIALLFLCLGGPLPGAATEGATEINQASVEAAGGFPLVIAKAGNYVLTSDLVVPAAKQAIVLLASDVVIDLRGFRIAGPHTCSVGGCGIGFVNGISGSEGSGRRVTVKGGAVQGFSGACIALLGESYVSEMFVSHCGRVGIELSQGSLVRASRVTGTGRQGISLVGEHIGYAENVVYLTGLGVGSVGPESVGIDGGTALGQNVCLRGACTPRGRRYYLTSQIFEGDEAAAPGNCDAGFHFASLYEILDPTGLTYDAARGATPFSDQGEGPPAGRQAWVRTGTASQWNPLAGSANCRSWTSAQLTERGSAVSLGISNGGDFDFEVGDWNDGLRSTIPPWIGGTAQCSLGRPIFCVEDR